MMNCLSESNTTKHLLTVHLFKTKNIFYYTLLFLVLLALFIKLLEYILKKKKISEKIMITNKKNFENYFKN